MSDIIIHKTKNHNACLARCRDYLELTKPRVVLLMLLTSYVGMHLAVPGLVAWPIMVFGTLGIALSAGSAAVINHLVDSKIDALMRRTRNRPIPTGKINPVHALIFSLTIGSIGLTILYFEINPLTAWLTLATLLGYAVCYTLFLKRATPQNIVIGGAAGAAPPLLGWTAVTGHISADALLLVLIIFVWTPPHFWALAIYRQAEYAKAKIPMLPVTHGIPFTKLCILLYTILLFVSLLLPFALGMSGVLYLVCAILLGLQFIRHSWRLYKSPDPQVAMATFKYSIIFLMLLFISLLMDHYLRNMLWH